MVSLATKYEGRGESVFPSLASIPEVTQKVLDRRAELKQALKDDVFLAMDKATQDEMTAISMLRAANIMKNALGDNIDDVNQNRKAFQCVDAYVGILEDINIDPETYAGE